MNLNLNRDADVTLRLGAAFTTIGATTGHGDLALIASTSHTQSGGLA